jgi:hypothetical protein
VYDPLVVNEYVINTKTNYLNSILNPFSIKHGKISWISGSEFTTDYILTKMDIVIVCIKQHNIEWNVIHKLEALGKKVYWFFNKDEIIKFGFAEGKACSIEQADGEQRAFNFSYFSSVSAPTHSLRVKGTESSGDSFLTFPPCLLLLTPCG